MLEHFQSRVSTELTYLIRSFHTKGVTTKSIWTFNLDKQNHIEAPIYVIFGFVQRDQFSQKQQVSETFYGSTVVIAECFIDSKENQTQDWIVIMLSITNHKHTDKLFHVLAL